MTHDLVVILASSPLFLVLFCSAVAAGDGSLEERVRTLEEQVLLQQKEIERLRQDLAGQGGARDALSAEIESLVAKFDDGSIPAAPGALLVRYDRSLRFTSPVNYHAGAKRSESAQPRRGEAATSQPPIPLASAGPEYPEQIFTMRVDVAR